MKKYLSILAIITACNSNGKKNEPTTKLQPAVNSSEKKNKPATKLQPAVNSSEKKNKPAAKLKPAFKPLVPDMAQDDNGYKRYLRLLKKGRIETWKEAYNVSNEDTRYTDKSFMWLHGYAFQMAEEEEATATLFADTFEAQMKQGKRPIWAHAYASQIVKDKNEQDAEKYADKYVSAYNRHPQPHLWRHEYADSIAIGWSNKKSRTYAGHINQGYSHEWASVYAEKRKKFFWPSLAKAYVNKYVPAYNNSDYTEKTDAWKDEYADSIALGYSNEWSKAYSDARRDQEKSHNEALDYANKYAPAYKEFPNQTPEWRDVYADCMGIGWSAEKSKAYSDARRDQEKSHDEALYYAEKYEDAFNDLDYTTGETTEWRHKYAEHRANDHPCIEAINFANSWD